MENNRRLKMADDAGAQRVRADRSGGIKEGGDGKAQAMEYDRRKGQVPDRVRGATASGSWVNEKQSREERIATAVSGRGGGGGGAGVSGVVSKRASTGRRDCRKREDRRTSWQEGNNSRFAEDSRKAGEGRSNVESSGAIGSAFKGASGLFSSSSSLSFSYGDDGNGVRERDGGDENDHDWHGTEVLRTSRSRGERKGEVFRDKYGHGEERGHDSGGGGGDANTCDGSHGEVRNRFLVMPARINARNGEGGQRAVQLDNDIESSRKTDTAATTLPTVRHGEDRGDVLTSEKNIFQKKEDERRQQGRPPSASSAVASLSRTSSSSVASSRGDSNHEQDDGDRGVIYPQTTEEASAFFVRKSINISNNLHRKSNINTTGFVAYPRTTVDSLATPAAATAVVRPKFSIGVSEKMATVPRNGSVAEARSGRSNSKTGATLDDTVGVGKDAAIVVEKSATVTWKDTTTVTWKDTAPVTRRSETTVSGKDRTVGFSDRGVTLVSDNESAGSRDAKGATTDSTPTMTWHLSSGDRGASCRSDNRSLAHNERSLAPSLVAGAIAHGCSTHQVTAEVLSLPPRRAEIVSSPTSSLDAFLCRMEDMDIDTNLGVSADSTRGLLDVPGVGGVGGGGDWQSDSNALNSPPVSNLHPSGFVLTPVASVTNALDSVRSVDSKTLKLGPVVRSDTMVSRPNISERKPLLEKGYQSNARAKTLSALFTSPISLADVPLALDIPSIQHNSVFSGGVQEGIPSIRATPCTTSARASSPEFNLLPSADPATSEIPLTLSTGHAPGRKTRSPAVAASPTPQCDVRKSNANKSDEGKRNPAFAEAIEFPTITEGPSFSSIKETAISGGANNSPLMNITPRNIARKVEETPPLSAKLPYNPSIDMVEASPTTVISDSRPINVTTRASQSLTNQKFTRASVEHFYSPASQSEDAVLHEEYEDDEVLWGTGTGRRRPLGPVLRSDEDPLRQCTSQR